jgi:DHA1 family bicyclomycin/chloramphenicol resistance-like MFS transporter
MTPPRAATRVPTRALPGSEVVSMSAHRLRIQPRPLRGWRVIAILGSLSLFGGLAVDMYLPAFPQMPSALHTRASEIELTFTACLVGFAVGQLIAGPLSDRWGRRRPVVVGIAGFAVTSIACALAPTVSALCVLRLFQGVCGGAALVMARTIVRDLFTGEEVARVFSTLLLVTAAAPLLAPQIGAELLRITSWRGIFVALTLIGSVLLLVAVLFVAETLPPERRHTGGFRQALRHAAVVCRDRSYLAYFLASTFAFGAIFAYISGSSFVLENIYGLTPQRFGLVYSLNALGIVLGSQMNARLVSKVGSARLLAAGLGAMSVVSLSLLVVLWTKRGGILDVDPLLFGLLFSLGFVSPNAMALAVRGHADSAGTAIAILGSSQFLIGAIVAPLVAIGGQHDARPMAIVVAAFALGAVSSRMVLAPGRFRRRTTSTVPVATLLPAEDLVQRRTS